MLNYSLSDYYLFYLIPPIIYGLLLLLFNVLPISKKINGLTYQLKLFFYFVAIGFSYLGLTIGLFVGLSETPVLSAFMPALLTFFGGFIAYLFFLGKKDSSIGNGFMIAVVLISMSFFMILGADYGAAIRNDGFFRERKFNHELEKEIILLKQKLNTQPNRTPVEANENDENTNQTLTKSAKTEEEDN